MTPAEQPARRDAGRTRQRLLDAASELFGTCGYERTTVRQVARGAGVDPALIGRYFHGKLGLYIAALRQRHGEDAAPLVDSARLVELLSRPAALGAGPIFSAAVMPHPDPAARAVAEAELTARLVAPLARHWAGGEEPRLRAEVAAAAVVGIVLARTAGTFTELSAAEPEHLARMVQALLAGLAGEDRT